MLYPDFARGWLSTSGYAPRTKQRWGATLRALQTEHPRQQLDGFTTQQLITHLSRPKQDGGALAPKSILADRAAITAAFKAARRHGHIKIDPAVDLRDDVHPANNPVKLGNWLSLDEAEALIGSCPDSDPGLRDSTLLRTGFATGLRRSELASLRWGSIHVRLDEPYLIVSEGKGRKTRAVGVSVKLQAAFEKWQARYEEGAGRAIAQTDPVFCPGKWSPMADPRHRIVWGTPLQPDGVSYIVATRSKAWGRQIGAHDMRRSFNGIMEAAGKSLDVRQQALGHSSPATTVQVYDRRDPRKAVTGMIGLDI